MHDKKNTILWEVVTNMKVICFMYNNGNSNSCGANCPIKKTAQIIEGKWTTLVIRELLPGKKRYNEIQKALTGISPKVLTTRLRHLQYHGLVKRTAYPTIPPTTEYTLTSQGQKLENVLKAMAEFGADLVDNRSDIPKN